MEKFKRLSEQICEYFIESSPVSATRMGIHDRDGELDDVSREKTEADQAKEREFIRHLNSIDRSGLDLGASIELDVFKEAFELGDLVHEQLDPISRYPSMYSDISITGLYSLFDRHPDLNAAKVAAATSRLRQFKRLLDQGKENLRRPPEVYTQIALRQTKGANAFLKELIPNVAKEAPSGGEELLAANEEALAALADFEVFLEKELLPRSDGDFAVGRELFDLMLKKRHFLDIDADTLMELGRDTVEKTKAELKSAAKAIDASKNWQEVVEDIKSDHPEPNKLKDTYQHHMQRAKELVIEKGLADIPSGEELRVVDTPVYMRHVMPYAAYSMPGPFEKDQIGLFYVTPVDETLPEEVQKSILSDHSIPNIKVVALHEAYPGHHLQLVCANRHKSRLRHFTHNTVFIEGWALYCEEMMREQGFLSDPKSYVLQLKAQLWRACRVVIDASLHTGNMSIEEGIKFLMDEALLAKPNATAEVNRYTMTPTQPMSYLLGKGEILKLKSKVEAKKGADFSLREFHNELISHGSLPTKFIAQLMLQ